MTPLRPLKPADAATLRERPLHLVIRDQPEALAVLRAHGVDTAGAGAEPLPAVLNGPELERVIDDLLQASDWRTRT
ncbi:MAG: hypothetical protein ACRELD_00605 [Longimicrobiales bacterium]